MPARFERFDTLCTASTPSSPAREDRRRPRRELDVALVARDDDAARARPGRDPGEVRVVGGRRRRVPRLVDPEHERAFGVGVADRVEVEVPVRVERRPEPRDTRRASRPSRSSGTRSPDTAPCRVRGSAAARGAAATRRAPWCRRTRRRARPRPPPRSGGRSTRGRVAQRRGAGRRRVAVRRGERVDRGAGRDLGNRVARCADRAVDDAARAANRRGASARRAARRGTAAGRNRWWPPSGPRLIATYARTRRSDRRRLRGAGPRTRVDDRRAPRRGPRRRGAARRARRRGRTGRRTPRRAPAPAADRRSRRAARPCPHPSPPRSRPSPDARASRMLQRPRRRRDPTCSTRAGAGRRRRRSRAARCSTACDARVGVGRARVDDVHQQVGVDDFFERRTERLDELVREAADEADRVGEHDRLAAGQMQAPHRGIERGEQLVLHEHARIA